jgi:hypothetical protein
VFEGETLDVGGTRFGDPQPVQADQHRERGVGMVRLLGSEQEPGRLTPIHPAPLRGLSLRPADVLGGVRGDASVEVGEPVAAAHRARRPVDRRRVAALLHRRATPLEVSASRGKHTEAMVVSPPEEAAQVMPVGLQRVVSVAGRERRCRELGFVGDHSGSPGP